MLNKYTTFRCFLMTSCVAVALASTGCRSMPGRNLFAFRNQPSAETLAGSGPTTTYPAPPSASATPEAIASVAGGTAPSKSVASKANPLTKSTTNVQVAGIDVSPGYATPASSTGPANLAAAQANGIYSGSAPSGSNPAVAAGSGYTFGTKALTPKTETNDLSPSANPTAGPSAYAKNASYGLPMGELKTPSTSYTPPPMPDYSMPAVASTPAVSTTDSVVTKAASKAPTPSVPSGGYTLPTDSPAIAAVTSATLGSTKSDAEEKPNAFAPPAAESPDFSTASLSGAVTAPGTTFKSPTAKVSSGSSGYTPGSTSTDHGYPTGDFEPSSGGSFFR